MTVNTRKRRMGIGTRPCIKMYSAVFPTLMSSTYNIVTLSSIKKMDGNLKVLISAFHFKKSIGMMIKHKNLMMDTT
jgi:hypothetical protein